MSEINRSFNPEEIIYNQRLKGELICVYIRFGLIALLILYVIIVFFNTSVEDIKQYEIVITRTAEITGIIIVSILNIIAFIRLKKHKKYSLMLSYILISSDFIILTVVNFFLTFDFTPSFVYNSAAITLYSLFIALAGWRYSFTVTIYAAILAVVCYLGLILLNGADILRLFGEEFPVFTGLDKSGEKVAIYFDIDDVVLRCIIYILMGLVIGLFAKDSRKKIENQTNLLKQNQELENTFVNNFTKSIDFNLKTSDTLKSSVNVLSDKFENMLKSLYSIEDNAKNQVKHIEESVTVTESLNMSFNRIESGINEQSALIENASKQIDELVDNINDISVTTQNASDMSSKLTRIAYDGSKAVENSLEAIREIEKSSEEIKVANNIINDIAEQTNILAMNATIEAANAGTVGRGFSVVANEIRNLATSSTSSVQRINDIVNTMLEKIEKGVTQSENVGAILGNIISGIETSSQLISSISQTAQKQNDSAKYIEQSMNKVVDKTKLIKSNISQERGMAVKVSDNAKYVVDIANKTETEVKKEVDSGKSIKQEIKSISQASDENKEIALYLRKELNSFN